MNIIVNPAETIKVLANKWTEWRKNAKIKKSFDTWEDYSNTFGVIHSKFKDRKMTRTEFVMKVVDLKKHYDGKFNRLD